MAGETYDQRNLTEALEHRESFLRLPEQLPTDDGTNLTLEVSQAINVVNGVRLRHHAYNGGVAGPTIRVRPGDHLRIHLENHLPAEPTVAHGENEPHGFNTTNLHTHGLHVSPRKPADDVLCEIPPGGDFQFDFFLPSDHPAGTFWYHAHKHGSTAFQLASGMAGALIVEGGLDEVPEIRAAEEKVLVIQQFVIRPVAGDVAIVDPQDVYEELVSPVTTINGVATPTIVLRPGEVQRWRLVHAGLEEPFTLELPGVKLYEIAVDGLATGYLLEKPAVELHPGNRVDLLVKAPRDETTQLGVSQVRNPKRNFRSQPPEPKGVMRVVVAGVPLDMPLPTPESLRPYAAFTDADVPSDAEIAQQRRFEMELRILPSEEFLINNSAFDPHQVMATLRLGTAEKWTLVGKAGGHPFHVHVNPFAVRRPASDPNPNRWQWRDTMFVEFEQEIEARTWFREFTGETVLHCHILDHEDQGMMHKIEIVPHGTPPVAAGRGAPALPLPLVDEAPGGASVASAIAAPAEQGKPSLVVFHRGLACEHCAQQVKLLAQQAAAFDAAGVQVVAISPELPAADELHDFLTKHGVQFPLLSDPNLGAFDQFGCLKDQRPLHGAFLRGPDGRVLWSQVGEEPVLDLEGVLTQWRELSHTSETR